MTYVDGFVAAVPTANREIYKKHAEAAAVVFKEHGAVKVICASKRFFLGPPWNFDPRVSIYSNRLCPGFGWLELTECNRNIGTWSPQSS